MRRRSREQATLFLFDSRTDVIFSKEPSMKAIHLFLVALTSVLAQSTAQPLAEDIRSKVTDTVRVEEKELIAPATSLLGIAAGTSEEQAFESLGKPDGYIRLNADTTAAIYGTSIAYLFTKGKLAGLRISHSIIDYTLVRQFSGHDGYRRNFWQLDNGISQDHSLKKIKGILGDKLKPSTPGPSRHHLYYEDGNARVHLYFSHFVDGGDKDEAYRLHGLLITISE